MSDATAPVIVTAYFFPRPDVRDQVIAALEPAIAGVHEEEGCELYAIHDAPDGAIVMLEKWTSAELLDAHGSGQPVATSPRRWTACSRARSRSPGWFRGPSGMRSRARCRDPAPGPGGTGIGT